MRRHVFGLSLCTALLTACGLIGPRLSQQSTAKQVVLELAYVGADDHIYISDLDGANRRDLTGQISGLSSDQGWTYRWPTYSPDGKRIAFAAYRSGSGGLGSAAVVASEVLQPKPTVLLESADVSPIYLYWSPDSRHLTALLQFGSELKLYVFDASGAEQQRELLAGQPLYWSWAPDGQTIAVHVGGAATSGGDAWIGLLHVGAGDARQERFADAPGLFQAPAWSPSGAQLAYALIGGGTTLLAIRDSGSRVNNVASGSGSIAFTWSPSGEWLAFAYGDPALPGVYRSLEVVHPDASDRHVLSQDRVVAFYWSPDSTRLAVVGIDSGARALTWTAVSVDGKTKRPLASFVPSTDFGFQLPFFDQYSQSISLWSADSKRVVYAAQNSAGDEQVVAVDADGATPGAPVTYGGAAVWSPPVAR